MYAPLSFLEHIKALRAWAFNNGASVTIDLQTFTVDVSLRNKNVTLHPLFRENVNGLPLNVPNFSSNTYGIVGWLPYRNRFDLSSSKLAFKVFLNKNKFKTPWMWTQSGLSPAVDFIIKNDVGSFGLTITGPFKANQKAILDDGDYAEQFILGSSLKIWVWGSTIFYATLIPNPTVTGDDEKTIDALIVDLAATQNPPVPLPKGNDAIINTSLAYQGYTRETVLPAGTTAWVNFIEGRAYLSAPVSEAEHNSLPRLSGNLTKKLQTVVDAINTELAKEFDAPQLFSVDVVVTKNDEPYFLEVNSWPNLLPTGYQVILDSLFT